MSFQLTPAAGQWWRNGKLKGGYAHAEAARNVNVQPALARVRASLHVREEMGGRWGIGVFAKVLGLRLC